MTLTATPSGDCPARPAVWWIAALLGCAPAYVLAQEDVLPDTSGGGVELTQQSRVYGSGDDEAGFGEDAQALPGAGVDSVVADFNLPDEIRGLKLMRLDVGVAVERLGAGGAEGPGWRIDLFDTCDSRWRKIGEDRAQRSTLNVAGSVRCYVGAGDKVKVRLRTDRPMGIASLEHANLEMMVFVDLEAAAESSSEPLERQRAAGLEPEPEPPAIESDETRQDDVERDAVDEGEPPAPDELADEAASSGEPDKGVEIASDSSQVSASIGGALDIEFDNTEFNDAASDNAEGDGLDMSSDDRGSSNDDPIYGVVTDLDALDSQDPDADGNDDGAQSPDDQDGDSDGDGSADEEDPDPTRAETLADVARWVLFVDNALDIGFELNIQSLIDSTNDLIVIDESNVESDATILPALSRAVPRLQQAALPKLVLALAEVANPNAGLPTAPAPLHLVRDDWETVWLGSTGLVRQLVVADFDGLYLIGLDRSVAELARSSDDAVAADPEGELVRRLIELASLARASDPEFLIVVQDASALSLAEDLSDVVDAVAEEQSWFVDFSPN